MTLRQLLESDLIERETVITVIKPIISRADNIMVTGWGSVWKR